MNTYEDGWYWALVKGHDTPEIVRLSNSKVADFVYITISGDENCFDLKDCTIVSKPIKPWVTMHTNGDKEHCGFPLRIEGVTIPRKDK
jgi:hypothetical protein